MNKRFLHFGPIRRLIENRGMVVRNKDRCVLCGKCIKGCPVGAILLEGRAAACTSTALNASGAEPV